MVAVAEMVDAFGCGPNVCNGRASSSLVGYPKRKGLIMPEEFGFRMPFCAFHEKRCVKEECPSYSNHRPISKEERERAWAADIPLFATSSNCQYCTRYNKVLPMEYYEEKDENSIS